MKEILYLLHLIIYKLNKIYAHLEVDWDSSSEKALTNRYKQIDLITKDIEKQDLDSREITKPF